MIPGVLALAASVIAVVCAIIWNAPYLCIAFAPSVLASLYLIYLGWDFHNLKSFAENNRQMKASILNLNEQNLELSKKLEFLEEENKKIKDSADKLSTLVGQLKIENFNLFESNKDLKLIVAGLQTLEKTLDTKAEKHMEQLDGLQGALTGLQDSATKDHETFGKNLEIFITQVELLKTTRSNFANAGSKIEKKMKNQVKVLLNTAKMLQGIFTSINEWKNEKHVRELISLGETHKLENSALTDKINNLKEELAKNDGRIEEQKKQINDLAKIKEGFETALSNLLHAIKQLQGFGEDAAKVRQAALIFRQYNLIIKD